MNMQEFMNSTGIYTVDDIIRLHPGNFFHKDNMKACHSKVSSEILLDPHKGIVYFITSEKNFNGTKRLYTIRMCDVIVN